jgi:hypothetical protein
VANLKSSPNYSVFTKIKKKFFLQFSIPGKMSSRTPGGYAYHRLKTTGLENVGAPTSHNNMGFHGLIKGKHYLLLHTPSHSPFICVLSSFCDNLLLH